MTVLRAFGFRFVVFSNDHSPPHVHVVGDGGEAKILLKPDGRATLDWAVGIARADLRRILRTAEAEHGRLYAAWRDLHG